MQQRVYQTKIRDVDELRKRLLNVWHWLSIEQCTIDSSIVQWHPQVKACIGYVPKADILNTVL